ncbi:hypothetical protein [Streptomyces sp. NRRL S-646]|uniref:hypothetical protein n=1 Tax=Streptomyces sp. NRRL S-646 TaxID=1463917 RepID=UPI0018FF371A|nr:hypothetical protein [Streptomyces sp. NRRL S-646]
MMDRRALLTDDRKSALGDKVTGSVKVQPVDTVRQLKGAVLAQGMTDGGPGQGGSAGDEGGQVVGAGAGVVAGEHVEGDDAVVGTAIAR